MLKLNIDFDIILPFVLHIGPTQDIFLKKSSMPQCLYVSDKEIPDEIRNSFIYDLDTRFASISSGFWEKSVFDLITDCEKNFPIFLKNHPHLIVKIKKTKLEGLVQQK